MSSTAALHSAAASPAAAQRYPGKTLPLIGIVTGWCLMLVAASAVHAPWAVRRGALFLHLASLVAGFGAVIVADLHGVLWLTGRRRLNQILDVTHALHPVIWCGLVGLTVSGIFLNPNLALPRTAIKLVLVLAAAVNGLWAGRLSKELGARAVDVPAGHVDGPLLAKVMVSGAVSQAAWWGATLIGFLATTSH